MDMELCHEINDNGGRLGNVRPKVLGSWGFDFDLSASQTFMFHRVSRSDMPCPMLRAYVTQCDSSNRDEV